MTCSPSQTAIEPRTTDAFAPADASATALVRADELLTRHGDTILATFAPPSGEREQAAARATALMDLFRRTGSSEAFECLIDVAGPSLYARARSRVRRLGVALDPQEVLQDAIVNVFRYPDKFAASRYNAFAAWSATIVDNAIRRQLRTRRTGPSVSLSPIEILSQQADCRTREPDRTAVEHEETRATASAFAVVLASYLAAFEQLSDRERFVLQMVEVRHMRYAELGELIGIRAETVKMVVFRARKRIHERMSSMLVPVAALRPAA